MSANYDIAVIGLAVMGQNLILNMDEHGHRVVAYNRTKKRTDEFLAGPAQGTQILGVDNIADLVESLSVPRKIMLMVKGRRQFQLCRFSTSRRESSKTQSIVRGQWCVRWRRGCTAWSVDDAGRARGCVAAD